MRFVLSHTSVPHDLITAIAIRDPIDYLYTISLRCGKFCLCILLDLPGFVATEVEKWLTKRFGWWGMPDRWVAELVFFLRRWFCKHWLQAPGVNIYKRWHSTVNRWSWCQKLLRKLRSANFWHIRSIERFNQDQQEVGRILLKSCPVVFRSSYPPFHCLSVFIIRVDWIYSKTLQRAIIYREHKHF